MHFIHLVQTHEGKERPVVVLTREIAMPFLGWITVAPVTSTRRGIDSEVKVGPENGIDHDSVINCDNIQSVRRYEIGPQVGQLTIEQEASLSKAIRHAFELLP